MTSKRFQTHAARRLLTAATLALVLAISAGRALAWQPYGGGVTLRGKLSGNPTKTIFSSDTAVLDAVRNGWQFAGRGLCDTLIEALGTEGAVLRGQTLYDMNCRGPGPDSLEIEPGADQVALHYRLPAIYLEFTSTQPFVGKWGDPRFSLSFDLELAIWVRRPAPPAGFLADDVDVWISNVQVDSHNLVGDVVMVADAVRRFFVGGPSLGTIMEAFVRVQNRNILIAFINVSRPVLALNAAIRELHGQGFSQFDWRFAPETGRLAMTMRGDSGVIGSFGRRNVQDMQRTVEDEVAVTMSRIGRYGEDTLATAVLEAEGTSSGRGIDPDKYVAIPGGLELVIPDPLPPVASVFDRLGLDAVALNPQPLPPRDGGIFDSPLDDIALNPQPLPPRDGGLFDSPLDHVVLNPQPLPPRYFGTWSMF